MDCWPGTNSCGADINHIEAGIFDPWINCDDLDLGTVLHQIPNTNNNNNANTNNNNSNSNSSSSNNIITITTNSTSSTNSATSSSPPVSSSSLSSASSSSSTSTTRSTSSSSTSSTGVQKVRRCRHITDYVLADEEKRLLIKEGHTDFPMICQARPLSKSEERILRKIRRKIRNKKSAQCSRQRKKEYVEDLERKYTAVIRENEELKQVINTIQQQHHQPQPQPQPQQLHHHQQQQQQHQLQHQQFGQFQQQSTICLDWKDYRLGMGV